MGTLVSRVLAHARSQPGALSLIAGGRRLTYGELCGPVPAAAAWLHGAGVRAGDVVALSLDAVYEHVISSIRVFYALAHLGAVILPLYPDVPRARRLDLMARFGARWVVSREPGEAQRGCSLIDASTFDWDSAAPGDGDAPRGDAPDRPFLFHFSGGTTGVPKAILFDHARFLENMLVGMREIGADASDRLVPARPWPTLPGLRYLGRIHAVGGAFVNLPCPETRTELDAVIRDTGATMLTASPWQLRRLLATPAPPAPRAPELKALYVIGAFIAPAEIQALRQHVTRNVYASYSASETGLIAALHPDDPVGAPGNLGRLVAGVEGRATGDDGSPLEPGTSGHLEFRASWIPRGYAGNEKATAERFRDGWFRPGDIGAVDAEGRVTVRGRADDVINYGGVKVMPTDIEPVIAGHPDVEDAAVAGVPHAMAGAVPVALVVLRREVSDEALAEYFRLRLEGSQVPVAFIRVPAILRSADGKVLRQRMVSEYEISAL
jgi:acyl-coenzyme A synthetase/AMP-(fatty) acid ligase